MSFALLIVSQCKPWGCGFESSSLTAYYCLFKSGFGGNQLERLTSVGFVLLLQVRGADGPAGRHAWCNCAEGQSEADPVP